MLELERLEWSITAKALLAAICRKGCSRTGQIINIEHTKKFLGPTEVLIVKEMKHCSSSPVPCYDVVVGVPGCEQILCR
jgi:hypothetical protein